MIKTVFVDIDNTLLDFDKCAKSSMFSGLQTAGLDYKEGLFETFKTVNDRLWIDIEKGVISTEYLLLHRWNLIFEKTGIAFDGVEFEKLFRKGLEESHECVEGAEELLKYLSGKYTVCAASNGPYEQQVKRLSDASLSYYISHMFISEEIGYKKPDKNFFSTCFSRLGDVTPAETVMIGDSLSADIVGGGNYGMKTCWFDHGKTGETMGVTPDCSVDNLAEIKKLL